MILHLSPRTRQKYRLIQVPNREKGKLEAEDLRRRRKRSLRSVGAPRRFEFGQIGSNVCNLSVLPSAAFHAAGLPAEISNKPGARSDERSIESLLPWRNFFAAGSRGFQGLVDQRFARRQTFPINERPKPHTFSRVVLLQPARETRTNSRDECFGIRARSS